MRQKFLQRLIICLIPTLIAAAFVAAGFKRESEGQTGFLRGIDLAGGTILVYEVNTEKLEKAGPNATPTQMDSEGIKKLADSLKRRIDPTDTKNVLVRPVGTTRIEIILPQTSNRGGKEGSTQDFVQEVKERVRQVGVLEFRILANSIDDIEGMNEARSIIDRAKSDPKLKAEYELLAQRGSPPPSPTNLYTVTVNNQTIPETSYQWVELGPEERETYGLSNAYETEAPKPRYGSQREHLHPRLTAVRNADGGAYSKSGTTFEFDGNLFLSRDFTRLQPPATEADKKVEYFLLTRISSVDAMKVDRDAGLNASSSKDNNKPVVSFSFGSSGARRFGSLTERNRAGEGQFRRKLAVIMDDRIVSAPNLKEKLSAGGIITGNFDQAGVNRLVFILRSGALNAELKPDPVSENTVGPTLGQDTIQKGLWAVGLAFAAVMAFMVVYYRFSGLVACIALLVNLLLTIGFMVAINAAFTLPGLAGVVLMLGMAVDANVLIYERIREERAKGANLVTSIRLGYDRAFATIIDTHLTSIFTCIVLYAFGNDNLKGFSVSLTVGLIISLFTALYMTRLMFDYATYTKIISDLKMMQLFPRPNFNYMKIRKLMFTITATLTVLGLGLFLYRGESGLNVDFTKGTAYGGRIVDGQERALNDTDKKGFLSLLGEQSQRDKLGVKNVVLAAGETIDGKTINENVYEITYADDTKQVVTFVNKPDGSTAESQIADVKKRASELPGLSVEQVYLTGESFGSGKSRSFTIRTTEKEPELVQVMLDRLLRDEKTGEALLAAPKVTESKISGPTATLKLDRPASPKFLSSLLERELKLINRWPTAGGVVGLKVDGIASQGGEELKTGQYSTFKVDVSTNPEFRALKEAFEANKLAADKKATDELAAFTSALEKSSKTFSARPLPDRLETFDPALAADTRNKAFYAIVASWVVVLIYLWFRFGNWTFGLAAVFCLIHDLCFTLGAIAICHYFYDNALGQLLQLHDFKIDLAAVAALLTLVGYSVNDTIVVFDRIREVRGKNPLLTEQMINDSVNQTLSRTVLASLTVFLVVGVLYFFGGEGVHLFSFVMVVGVVVGTYSSIYIASPLLLIFGEGKPKADTRAPMKTMAVTAG
ncbi:MAG: protein translocase subunit SecD [Fimbriiglobus sp.]